MAGTGRTSPGIVPDSPLEKALTPTPAKPGVSSDPTGAAHSGNGLEFAGGAVEKPRYGEPCNGWAFIRAGARLNYPKIALQLFANM